MAHRSSSNQPAWRDHDKVANLISTLPELDPDKSVGLRLGVDIDITTPFKLFEDNLLATDSKFVLFVVSSAGEFSREAYQFREFLVSVFRRRVESTRL